MSVLHICSLLKYSHIIIFFFVAVSIALCPAAPSTWTRTSKQRFPFHMWSGHGCCRRSLMVRLIYILRQLECIYLVCSVPVHSTIRILFIAYKSMNIHALPGRSVVVGVNEWTCCRAGRKEKFSDSLSKSVPFRESGSGLRTIHVAYFVFCAARICALHCNMIDRSLTRHCCVHMFIIIIGETRL